MNKWVSRVLITVLFLTVLTGVGYISYRMGYEQRALADGNGRGLLFHRFDDTQKFEGNKAPQFRPSITGRGFNPGFGPGRFSPLYRGRNIGISSPFQFLFRIAILALAIWFGYKLFKGNGWTLSLTRQSTNTEVDKNTTRKKSTESSE